MNAKQWLLSGIVIAAAGIGWMTYVHQKGGRRREDGPGVWYASRGAFFAERF